MSFGFNTSLEQAEQAHLEMEATTAPPPPPPGAPATAVAPPVAVPAAPAPAAPKKQQSFKALDRVDARFQKGELRTRGPSRRRCHASDCVEINLHHRVDGVGGLRRRRPRVRRPRGADPQGDRRARRHRVPRRRRGGGGTRRRGRRGDGVVEPAGRGAEPGRAAAAAVWLDPSL